MADTIRGLTDEQLVEYEAQAEQAMLTALESVMGRIAEHLGATRTASALVAAGPESVSPDDLAGITPLWSAAVQDDLLPVVAEVYQDAAGTVHAQLIDATDLPSIPPVTSLASEAYLAQAANTFDEVGADLWETARGELLDGFQQGESIPELRDRLRASAGLTGRNATLVARTQVLDASNAGSYDTARVSGLDLLKGWEATPDARTRDTHSAAGAFYQGDGMVPLNGKFTVGGFQCDRPHDPSLPPAERYNCRCTLIYAMAPVVPTPPRDRSAEIEEWHAQRLAQVKAQHDQRLAEAAERHARRLADLDAADAAETVVQAAQTRHAARLAKLAASYEARRAALAEERARRLGEHAGRPEIPEVPDLARAARERQARIDATRTVAQASIQLDEVAANRLSARALAHRARAAHASGGVDQATLDELLAAAERLDYDGYRAVADRVGRQAGLTSIGRAGEQTAFDRTRQVSIGADLPEGTMVTVVRRGYVLDDDGTGKPVVLERAAVQLREPAGIPSPGPTIVTPELEIEEQVRAAYDRLRPGNVTDDWVSLADLRDELSGLSRQDVDAALRRMVSKPGVVVIPESEQLGMSARIRDAAIRLGTQEKHYISIERIRPLPSAVAPGPAGVPSAVGPTAVPVRASLMRARTLSGVQAVFVRERRAALAGYTGTSRPHTWLGMARFEGDLQTAREHAEGLLRGIERFPLIPIQVRPTTIPGTFYARTINGRTIEIADRWSGDRPAYLASIQQATMPDTGGISRWHPAGTGSPQAIALHEFGHALADYVSRRRGPTYVRARIDETVRIYAAERGLSEDKLIEREISLYAASRTEELIGEAFADAMVNGDAASVLSRRIMAVLVDEYDRTTGVAGRGALGRVLPSTPRPTLAEVDPLARGVAEALQALTTGRTLTEVRTILEALPEAKDALKVARRATSTTGLTRSLSALATRRGLTLPSARELKAIQTAERAALVAERKAARAAAAEAARVARAEKVRQAQVKRQVKAVERGEFQHLTLVEKHAGGASYTDPAGGRWMVETFASETDARERALYAALQDLVTRDAADPPLRFAIGRGAPDLKGWQVAYPDLAAPPAGVSPADWLAVPLARLQAVTPAKIKALVAKAGLRSDLADELLVARAAAITEAKKQSRVRPSYLDAENSLLLENYAESIGINLRRYVDPARRQMVTAGEPMDEQRPFSFWLTDIIDGLKSGQVNLPAAIALLRKIPQAVENDLKWARQNVARGYPQQRDLAIIRDADLALVAPRLADALEGLKLPRRARKPTLGALTRSEIAEIDESIFAVPESGRFTGGLSPKGGLVLHRGQVVPDSFEHPRSGMALLQDRRAPLRPGLTDAENHALDLYVSSAVADPLNGALRAGLTPPTVDLTVLGEKVATDLREVQRLLDEVIAASELSRDTTLWRGALMRPADLRKLTPGAIITESSYLSTAVERTLARNIISWRKKNAPAYQKPVLFRILTRKGTHAAVGHEAAGEVLFGRNTRLQVIRSEVEEWSGTTIITVMML